MNYLFFTILLMSFLSVTGHTEIPIIKASEASYPSYKAYINQNPKFVAYSEYVIKERTYSSESQKLDSLFEQALKQYLKGSLQHAFDLFEQVLKLSSSADWRNKDRGKFIYSNLRLAQISTDQNRKNQYLFEAAKWGPSDLSSEYFPPEIWKKYQELLQQKETKLFDFESQFKEARYLLLDGRPIAVEPLLRLSIDHLDHRFTIVYDDALPVTRVTNWKEFSDWVPRREFLMDKTCENYRGVNTSPEFALFFSSECVIEADLLKMRAPNKDHAISIKDLNPETPSQKSDLQNMIAPPATPTKWVKPTLIYGGILTVAALVIKASIDHNKKRTPTETHDF